jgi:DNA adenine methylase/adenine-specific DNA-methyltransferase
MCLIPNITKTPLNYTGNKSRILDQILPLFPKKTNRFVDLCCGGASVGLNVADRAEEVVCLDINKEVICILQTLLLFPEKSIITKVEDIIKKFGLSDSFNNGYEKYKKYIDGNNGLKNFNKNGYMKLRDHFNNSTLDLYDRAFHLLVLLSYGFNNDIRFNSSGKFNMPIGKTDFNGSMRDKLRSFKQGTNGKNIKFYLADFSIVKEFELGKNDFVYVDPPYLITNAVYNENDGWGEQQEKKLLETLDYLHKTDVKFAISNVLSKQGITNTLLASWIKKNRFKVIDINYHYRSASYNKKNRSANEKEIVVLNYEPEK